MKISESVGEIRQLLFDAELSFFVRENTTKWIRRLFRYLIKTKVISHFLKN